MPNRHTSQSAYRESDIELMRKIARQRRIVYARGTLARLLHWMYRDGATLTELAGYIERTPSLVRSLITEAGGTIRPTGNRVQVETAGPVIWQGMPEPMTRMQPDSFEWSWQDTAAYNAELVLELYVQGRSYYEVAAVTGYPADDIRAMALAAGVARPRRVEEMMAAWRRRSLQKLSQLHRPDLMYAWVDGAEVEELAKKHAVPADMMWDVVASELARVKYKRNLTVRALPPPPTGHPPCAHTTCVHDCIKTCALTVPTTQPAERAHPGGPWPPMKALDDQLIINDDGTVTWRWFSQPPD